MKIKNLVLLPFFVLTTACASFQNYAGPNPDYTAADKTKEIETFTVVDDVGYFDNVSVVEMGPQKTAYTRESMKSLILKVSPEASQKIEKAQGINFAGMLMAQAGILIALASSESSSKLPAIGLLGAGIGVMTYSRTIHSDGLENYNRDLRKKLTPGLTWNHNF